MERLSLAPNVPVQRFPQESQVFWMKAANTGLNIVFSSSENLVVYGTFGEPRGSGRVAAVRTKGPTAFVFTLIP